MQHSEHDPDLYKRHIDAVTDTWAEAMAHAGYDAAIVTAGEARNHFLDDQAPPLKLNPHFLQWCPAETAAGSALLIRPGTTPKLYFLRQDDYWHQPPELPEFAEQFEVDVFADREALLGAIGRDALIGANHVALIGDSAIDLPGDHPGEDVNPDLLLNHLHFSRAEKTPFELACMRAATAKAVRGHLAAKQAFEAGESEFHINLAYLKACGQLPAELPYQNIVALNEHAGVLHYQHYDPLPPAERASFLIDAGGSHHGYASDITRTYAGDDSSLFGELIERLDSAQQDLIASIEGGVDYVGLHTDMHRRLAELLSDAGIIKGSAEAAFERGLTETFLPHGLGHLIGLQTHDVGGQQQTPEGDLRPPPDNYPALRLTRSIGPAVPVTIEPGLYFIPQLLDAARQGPDSALINWPLIETLLPCGGIRIEDNVVVSADGVENMTRDAFAALEDVRD